MLPESGFVVTELKNELRRHTGNKQATSLLQESKQFPGQIHTHTYTYTRPECPVKTGHAVTTRRKYQEQGERPQQILPSEPSEGTSLADTLISDFEPLEL